MGSRRKVNRFGQNTRAKVFGGKVEFRTENPQGAIDWVTRADDLSVKINDWSPVFRPFAAYMIRSIDRNFGAGGRPVKWQPLNPRYLAYKKRKGYKTTTLEKTGKMRKQFKAEFGPRSLRISNTSKFFNVHQYGSKKRNIPSRIMITMQVRDKAEFTRLKRRHLGN